jgi:hypothetical protein
MLASLYADAERTFDPTSINAEINLVLKRRNWISTSASTFVAFLWSTEHKRQTLLQLQENLDLLQ